MAKKIGWGVLILILTISVLLGAYLAVVRFSVELQNRKVEIVVDLNDLKKMAAYDKKPLGPILEEIRKMGITSIGVFEETLPEANANGELYCVKGTAMPLVSNYLPIFKNLINKIKGDRTYLYIPNAQVRKRVFNQLRWALGEKSIKFIGKEIIEVDEIEEELRNLGMGISELTSNFLSKMGFTIVPRVWNDPRYHIGNIEEKISGLGGYRLIIFDGEEILGYPDAIPALASALKKVGLKYGYIEIVKQDGDKQLRKLMKDEVIRVHSVPKDELKKITKDEALERFVRAARERGVRVIYLRPFLPPQIDAYPVSYNLKYFRELKDRLEKAGFVLGKAESFPTFTVKGWQILILGAGVLIGAILLLNCFTSLAIWINYLLFLLGFVLIFGLGVFWGKPLLQKILAFACALAFPSYAVISTFSKAKEKPASFWLMIQMVLNILMETAIGVFLVVGILFDSGFISGVATFPAVKGALILPIIMVFCYFFFKEKSGNLRSRIQEYLQAQISVLNLLWFLLVLGALGILVARSGNFTIPVPAIEKYFRGLLETILWIRPRTKEFLIGYPFLFLSAVYILKGRRKWLWLLASMGTIAPVSVFNSFCHIHTPLVISLLRTFNGLVLGILVGWVAMQIFEKILEKENNL